MKDLTLDPKISIVSDLMFHIEEEVTMVKAGVLKAAEGNVVMRGRGHQIKALEMFLQAARLAPKMQSDIPRVLGLIAQPKEKAIVFSRKGTKSTRTA